MSPLAAYFSLYVVVSCQCAPPLSGRPGFCIVRPSSTLLTMNTIQQRRCQSLLFLVVCACWTVGKRPSAAYFLSPSTSTRQLSSIIPSPTSTSAPAPLAATTTTMISDSTGSRQAAVQLPSGRFTACWPVGLGQYNGGPAVFLATKRRILDPREEVFPVPIPDEAVSLLSEASECVRAYPPMFVHVLTAVTLISVSYFFCKWRRSVSSRWDHLVC